MKHRLRGGAFALPAVISFLSFACSSAPATKTIDDDGGATSDTGTPEAGTTEAASVGTTFAEVYTMILDASCVNSTCHFIQAGPAQGDLDMSSQTVAYAALVNVPATTPPGETPPCTGDRVVPGSPSTSLMYLKVSEASPPCGVHMPLTGMALTAQEIGLIQTWIAEGANP